MAGVHYPTNAGQAWARREAIRGDARLASEVPILLKSVVQCTDWAQWIAAASHQPLSHQQICRESSRDVPDHCQRLVRMDGFKLRDAAERGDLSAVRGELDAGVDPNSSGGPSRSTALHAASRRGRSDVVALLLRRGGDPMRQNAAGQTAMDLAKAGGKADVVSVLRSGVRGPRATAPPRTPQPQEIAATPYHHSPGSPKSFLAVQAPDLGGWFNRVEHQKRREKRRTEFAELLQMTAETYPFKAGSLAQPSHAGIAFVKAGLGGMRLGQVPSSRPVQPGYGSSQRPPPASPTSPVDSTVGDIVLRNASPIASAATDRSRAARLVLQKTAASPPSAAASTEGMSPARTGRYTKTSLTSGYRARASDGQEPAPHPATVRRPAEWRKTNQPASPARHTINLKLEPATPQARAEKEAALLKAKADAQAQQKAQEQAAAAAAERSREEEVARKQAAEQAAAEAAAAEAAAAEAAAAEAAAQPEPEPEIEAPAPAPAPCPEPEPEPEPEAEPEADPGVTEAEAEPAAAEQPPEVEKSAAPAGKKAVPAGKPVKNLRPPPPSKKGKKGPPSMPAKKGPPSMPGKKAPPKKKGAPPPMKKKGGPPPMK
jgi:hypothetical protein